MRTRIDEMSPYAHFGIVGSLDKNKDYSTFAEDETFHDCLEKYHCVAITDDIINDWWKRLTLINTYYHSYNRPEKALARYGVTLIPPKSLQFFIEIINNDTSPYFAEMCAKDISDLLNLLSTARNENRFVIHYGV